MSAAIAVMRWLGRHNKLIEFILAPLEWTQQKKISMIENVVYILCSPWSSNLMLHHFFPFCSSRFSFSLFCFSCYVTLVHVKYNLGVCTNATAPSVSSINRILRNRAAERAAAEFARAAGYGLYPPNPYAGFPWPSTAHLWPPGAGFPGISPGSTTTASGTAGSPGSGSHDTLGSSDGSRMIGKINFH